MSKQLTNQRFFNAFGVTMKDRERALETMHRIKSRDGLVGRLSESKAFFSLPTSVFLKAIAAFSASKRGLLIEKYRARNLENVRFTQTNEYHKGDLTDGHGHTHEIKSSGISSERRATFSGIRPDDDVDFFHFIVNHGDHLVDYEIPRTHLDRMPLYRARDTNTKSVSFRVDGPTAADIADLATVHVLDDTTTGQRWDSLRFLEEADLRNKDLDHLKTTLENVRTSVAGSGTTATVSMDELMAVRPLVTESKFGSMVQDWLADHLEVAVARTSGKGDGVGKDAKIEIKYASLAKDGAYHIGGLKPSEFDELYFALRTEDDLEFFKLTKRSAMGFIRDFGRQTNTGIFRVKVSAGGRARDFLSRKAVDLNVRSH